MALKLKSDKLFKATVKLNDELEKEVTYTTSSRCLFKFRR